MKTIHITDAGKASLVMSSEIFKDKVPGSMVLVSTTGKDCIDLLIHRSGISAPDICVVDFDLPDVDGVTLIREMRKYFRGPILLTAYPDKVVQEAVANDLFAYNDAGAWIAKPIRFEDLEKRIEQFLLDNHRLGKRFPIEMKTQIVGKGAGRGKRSPKVDGKIINLSFGGVCVAMPPTFKLKNGEEMTLSLHLPVETATTQLAATKKTPTTKIKTTESKVKATVAWTKDGGKLAGFQFAKLTDGQKRGLEMLLKGLNA